MIIRSFAATTGKLSVFIGKSCGILYLTAIALSVYEVFLRYALDAPTAWTNETVMALCATAWMLSVGAVTQQHRHITVTVMEILVGERAWRRMAKLAVLVSMLAAGGLLFACWDPMMSALRSVQTSGSAFDPPTPTYVKTMLVVACGFYLVQLLANLLSPADHEHHHGTSDVDVADDVTEPR